MKIYCIVPIIYATSCATGLVHTDGRYVRGHPLDYERWEKREGASGWGWDDVLPYFKRAERYSHYSADDPDSLAYHGDAGPLRVTRAPADRHPLSRAFLAAGAQANFPVAPEMNGRTCGAALAPMDFTIGEGKRWSAAEAYLGPAAGSPLPNLRLELGVHTHRLLFDDDKKVVGAELVRFSFSAYTRARACCGVLAVLAVMGVVRIPVFLNFPSTHQRAPKELHKHGDSSLSASERCVHALSALLHHGRIIVCCCG